MRALFKDADLVEVAVEPLVVPLEEYALATKFSLLRGR
jgi:hypothetical protein